MSLCVGQAAERERERSFVFAPAPLEYSDRDGDDTEAGARCYGWNMTPTAFLYATTSSLPAAIWKAQGCKCRQASCQCH